MVKRTGILFLITMLLSVTVLAGCGQTDERTRLKNMFVDLVCNYTKKIRDNAAKVGTADEAGMQAIREENDKLDQGMEELPKKYGFNGEKEVNTAMNKYEEDKNLEAEILKGVKDSCGFDLESLDSL